MIGSFVVVAQPTSRQQCASALLLPRQGGGAVAGSEVWVGGRTPLRGVDAVADAREVVAARPELVIEAHTRLGPDDLAGVGGADGQDPVGATDGSQQRVDRSPPLVAVAVKGKPIEQPRAVGALVAEGVDGEDDRRWRRQEGRDGAHVPVVEMDQIGLAIIDEAGDRRRERQESMAVVRPAVAVGVDVRVGLVDAGAADEGDRPETVE